MKHSTKPCTKHPLEKGIQVYSNEGPHPLQRGDNSDNTFAKVKNSFLQNHLLATFNQTFFFLFAQMDSKGRYRSKTFILPACIIIALLKFIYCKEPLGFCSLLECSPGVGKVGCSILSRDRPKS